MKTPPKERPSIREQFRLFSRPYGDETDLTLVQLPVRVPPKCVRARSRWPLELGPVGAIRAGTVPRQVTPTAISAAAQSVDVLLSLACAERPFGQPGCYHATA